MENLPSTNILPSTQEFQMFQVISKNAQDSGLYNGIGQQAKIFMILLAARELGIPPLLALNGGIWNIQGKIEISARLMNTLIRRAGHTLRIRTTDKECEITGKRKDTGEEHTEVFTWIMAEKAGLTKNPVWAKYPEDMLYNRCISRLGRRLFADVIGNSYVEGEISTEIQEKNLPKADYEEIKTIFIKDPEPENLEKPNEEPINEEEYLNFLEMSAKVDDQCKENMFKYLKETCGIEDAKNMTKKQYQSCLKGMSNNLKLQEDMRKKNEISYI